MKALIKREGEKYVAYAETGERLCSDPIYEDCVIKVGLLGHSMDVVPPNSWEAEQIRDRVERFG